MDEAPGKPSDTGLNVKKGRLCCPVDQAPLFSIVDRNLEKYEYRVVCNSCLNEYADYRP